jgi:T5SS/PEP-CTERM-associated repeat protein
MNQNAVWVGYDGSGRLDILEGADVICGDLFGVVGQRPGATGILNISGAGSTYDTGGPMFIASNGGASGGTALVDIQNGGAFITGDGGLIGVNGQVEVGTGGMYTSGGLITLYGSIDAGAGGIVTAAAIDVYADGTLVAADGATITQSDHLNLKAGAAMELRSGATYTGNHATGGVIAVGATAGATATLTVDGQGTAMTTNGTLVAGYGGTGAINVTGGARVDAYVGAIGGFDPGTGADGTLAADGVSAMGTPSTWKSTYLTIGLGETSHSEAAITNGALLDAGELFVGGYGEGSLVVDGTSSSGAPSRVQTGLLNVAYGIASTGELTASGGARIGAGNIFVSPQGGTGTLTLTDPETMLAQSAAATIAVGYTMGGEASLTVKNGARLTTGTGPIAVNATGEINLESGGTLDANGPITLNDGDFNFLGGTLHVGAFNGNLVNQGGTLAPGDSPGHTAVSGNYTQRAGGTLEIEISGVLAGQWDTLAVTGNAVLDGTLSVKLVDGFEPVLGNSFTILTTDAGNVGGAFDFEVLPTVGGVTFDVVYGPKSVTLVAQAGFSADFDGDGDVDAADLAEWRGDFGLNADSDADADGDSDGDDFLAWQRQVGGGAPAAAVPEPAGVFLLACGAAVVGAWRGRPRTRRRGGGQVHRGV